MPAVLAVHWYQFAVNLSVVHALDLSVFAVSHD
jgi:hypothetical protein